MRAAPSGVKIGTTTEQIINGLLKNFFFGFRRYDKTFFVFFDWKAGVHTPRLASVKFIPLNKL
jgi:hypothetical protein